MAPPAQETCPTGTSVACASLSALISVEAAPFAERGDCSALASLLADVTSSSKTPLGVFRFFGQHITLDAQHRR